MSLYFVDTSALCKRYVFETGSHWVINLTEPRNEHTIVMSQLTLIEVVASLARRQREGAIDPTFFVELQNQFLLHAKKQYTVITLGMKIITLARQLVAKHPLRTLDSLQLASALLAQKQVEMPLIFVSSDQKKITHYCCF